VIASADIAGLARVEGEWLVLEVEPGSGRHRRLDRYASGLEVLGQTVEGMLGQRLRSS